MDDCRFLERALELAERGRGTTHPNPIVGAVVVAGGEVVGEGWHERKGGPHAEIVALEAAGERARGRDGLRHARALRASRHDAAVRRRARSRRASRGSSQASSTRTPAHGGGLDRLRASGSRRRAGRGRARVPLPPADRGVANVGDARERPFVTYKVAVTLDGRVRVPGSRWITGEESRRLVHVLRAQSDAVAVGHGHRALGQPTPRRARRPRRAAAAADRVRARAAARGLGARAALGAALREELEALAADGVQSLLLEGGPTLAAAFLEQGLVDKLLVFVAPTLSGEGPGMLAGLPRAARAVAGSRRARSARTCSSRRTSTRR